MLSKKFNLTLLALLTLSGCGGNTTTDTPIAQLNTGITLTAPSRIRESQAINPNAVTGKINVNGREFDMTRTGTGFRAVISDIPANSDATITITFSERLPDGRELSLARTNQINVSVGASNQTRQILQEEYIYDYDEDGDGISNIIERNNDTDPYVENGPVVVVPITNRRVEARFFLPQIINDPDITQSTALIADTPRLIDRSSTSIRIATADNVPSNINFLIDIRLSQRYNGQTVLIAQAVREQTAGESPVLVTFNDSDFNFSFDADNDGVTNLAEMQAGTDPFVRN